MERRLTASGSPEVFRDIRPANAYIVVAGLVDPRWLVEIEADAILPART